jgi:hypothetical protein
MRIISPTYKRAGNVKAVKYFDGLVLACHEFEEKSYREAYPDNELMILPDSLRGNMAKVRNYILLNSDDAQLVMIDDDVEFLGYHENGVQKVMPWPESLRFLEMGFRMAEELGTVLWGVNLQADPKFYRPYTPISFLSPVLGPFSCILNQGDGITYDERLGLNEDYDFAIQVMHRYHKILRFNKYFYRAGHLDEEGGCGAYRTMEREKTQADIMKAKWGDVVRYDFKRSTNPIIKIPLRGV